MNRIWNDLVRSSMIGTQRAPVSDTVREQLGIGTADDPARTGMLALAAAHLLHKAAHPPAGIPVALPAPCPPDERPVCPPDAVRALRAMLAGTYPEALPEWWQLLEQSGQRVPPELWPFLLVQIRDFDPEEWRQRLYPTGLWLAAQHPEWAAKVLAPEPDWETGRLQERLLLLKQLRAADPAAALALVEKTWSADPPAQRLRFLKILRSGLSLADEPLLARATGDKDYKVRGEALRLLLALPESRLAQAVKGLLAQHLGRAQSPEAPLAALEAVLDANLPLDAAPGRNASGRSLRQLIAGAGAPVPALMGMLPPAMVAHAAGLSVEQLLDVTMAPEWPAELQVAVLESVCWYRDPDWLAATAAYFDRLPEHPLWNAPALAGLLDELPEPLWQQALSTLCRHLSLLEQPESALIKALERRIRWPAALFHAVVTYPLRAGQARTWQAPRHLRRLLQHAAYHCRPEDAAAFQQQEGEWPYAWQGELVQVWAVVRFRQQMRKSFGL